MGLGEVGPMVESAFLSTRDGRSIFRCGLPTVGRDLEP